MTLRLLPIACLLLATCIGEVPGPAPDDDDTLQDDDDSTLDDDDSVLDDDDSALDDDDSTLPPDFDALDPYVQPSVHVAPPDAGPGETITLTYTGALDDREQLVAHYGFDGWNLAAEGLESEVDGDDTAWFAETGMVPSPDGFTMTLDLPADARALHVAFTDPDAEEWDNNDGLDYHWAFGGPYAGPWLTWNEVAGPSSGVVVNWESSVPCLGIVEHGPTEELGQWVVGEVTDTIHHVPLTGLEPDMAVFYRLRESSGVTGQVRSFRTAPAEPEGFRFVALGDMQDNGENQRWSEVAAAVLAEQAEADFLLVTGDMPANDKPGHWWTFFDKGRELFAGRVMMPTVGNHDTPGDSSDEDTSSFRRYFELPGEQNWYAFDYGDARFVALSSENGTFGPGEAQYVFMEGALAGATGPVFATWHKPPYNAGSRHGAEQQETRPITALLDGAVDWVLSGHEHFYQRMVPIRYEAVAAPSGQYGREEDDGVGYLVLPPAGNAPLGDLFEAGSLYADARPLLAWPEVDDEDETGDSELGFVVVEVGAAGIVVQTYAMGDLDEPTEPRLIDGVDGSR